MSARRVVLLPLLVACAEEEPGPPADPCAAPRPPVGVICRVAGRPDEASFAEEGLPALESGLYLPIDTTLGPDGLLYVLDWNNHRIRRIEADGTMRTLAGVGTLGDGPEGDALAAALNHPTNVKFDPRDDRSMVVAAWHNSRIERVDLSTGLLSFACGTGDRAFSGNGGPASVADLDLPSSLEFDEDGTMYLADTANQILRVVTPDGVIETLAGTEPPGLLEDGTTDRRYGWEGDGGPALAAKFNFGWGQRGYPGGRVERDGRLLYVTDSYNFVVRVVDLDAGTVDHVAGTGLLTGYDGDGGPATEAVLAFPTDLAADEDGALYVADTFNHCVRAIDPDGTIRTAVGVCTEPGSDGDGGPATEAHLLNPFGIEVAAGTLWVSDTENHVVRAVRLRD